MTYQFYGAEPHTVKGVPLPGGPPRPGNMPGSAALDSPLEIVTIGARIGHGNQAAR